MTYQITDTTDEKFVGKTIEADNLDVGDKFALDEYIFEVVKKRVDGDNIVVSNSNYVITLKPVVE